MIAGAFRLPVVIVRHGRRVGDAQAFDADHAQFRIDHRKRIVWRADPAGTAGMIGALHLLADEGVDRLRR